MAYSTRDVPRDAVMYSLLRSALANFAKENSLGRYDHHFASVLGYDSKTAHVQFLAGLGEVSARMFSVDEFVVLIRELGLNASPVINQLLSGTGLVCVPSEKTDFEKISHFPALHLISSGSLVSSLKNALSDDKLTTKEKSEIASGIDEIMALLASLRDSVKEYGNV